MTTANFIFVITFATLGLYSTNLKTLVRASGCVRLPQNEICDISWNVTNTTVSGSHDNFEDINSTRNAVAEANVQNECVLAIQNLSCISAFTACNCTNTSLLVNSTIQKQCKVVENNCTDLIAKIYGSKLCSQINGYNDSECVNVTLSSNGYCPFNETYKVLAKNIKDFLKKASQEKTKLKDVQTNNISSKCLTDYKRMTCKTFVQTCQEESTITKESCEDKLQCLPPSNSFFNKTRLCSNFPSKPQTTISTTQVVTTTRAPYDFKKGFNTSVTVLLNTKFEQDYSNKSSSLYKSFARNVTDGLKIAYKEVAGLQGVFIEELTCHEEVAVKHTVVTSSRINVKVIGARLILANDTSGLYLEGKVVEANKPCVDDDHHGHEDDHTDSNSWVYMIVFVCITALLLLAMVLCHQSK